MTCRCDILREEIKLATKLLERGDVSTVFHGTSESFNASDIDNGLGPRRFDRKQRSERIATRFLDVTVMRIIRHRIRYDFQSSSTNKSIAHVRDKPQISNLIAAKYLKITLVMEPLHCPNACFDATTLNNVPPGMRKQTLINIPQRLASLKLNLE
jgi:hypothetical protein